MNISWHRHHITSLKILKCPVVKPIRLYFTGLFCLYFQSMTFFYVYVISSIESGEFYIGYSQNLKKRLADHNSGKNHSTKLKKPWQLIYFEGYKDKQDALGREKFLKSGSGSKYLRKQLAHYLKSQIT